MYCYYTRTYTAILAVFMKQTLKHLKDTTPKLGETI